MTVPPPDPYAPQQPGISAPLPPDGYPSPAGAPAPAGPPPGYGVPQAPTDGVSVGALVTGVLGMALVPVGLGIAGIVRTGGGRRRGRGLAIAGLVLGVLSTVVWGFVVAGALLLATNGEAFEEAVAESVQDGFSEALDEQTGADLAVGDCFEPPADLAGGDPIRSVDCTEPHTAEAFAVLELPDGDFPGMESVAAEAEARCLDQFEAYVGAPYDESTLGVVYFHPTDVSWTLGDRTVICGAESYTGSPLTGSVAGTGL